MNQKSFFSRQRQRELGGVLLLYIVCGLAYGWALFFTSGGDWTYFGYIGLDYLIKGFWTVPVWLIVFRLLKSRPRWQRYLSHSIFMPLWVGLWIQTFYFICEQVGYFHLQGKGIGWDIYIPALFYLIQFGVFHLYDESQRLIRQQKRANDLREMALKNELSALKAQLNPHFLYNVFNTINASLPPQEEHTRELVAKLADLFRYQLKASKLDTVPLADELEFVKAYLELEKARYRERLTISWKVDPALHRVPVPPMLLQPIVENAIRHGISPKIEGGTVAIEIKSCDGQVCIAVIDDGVGFQASHDSVGTGVGLQNTRKMLEGLYGTTLEIHANAPSGTRVAFFIPLQTPVAPVLT